MRIWDVHPGYLSRQSLLGEHREIHGLFNILTQGKKGYSKHPETLRWVGLESALASRHSALVAEMALRGYQHHSPMYFGKGDLSRYPESFIDTPGEQFRLLGGKYQGQFQGRIPLPRNCQEFWAQHKYSVMARSPSLYKELGPLVASEGSASWFDELALKLTLALRLPLQNDRARNAVEHLWGYVSSHASSLGMPKPDNLGEMMTQIAYLSVKGNVTYLIHSTALSDLTRTFHQ